MRPGTAGFGIVKVGSSASLVRERPRYDRHFRAGTTEIASSAVTVSLYLIQSAHALRSR